MIPFNKSSLSKKSNQYLQESINSKFYIGDGPFTELCQDFFNNKYSFQHSLLTTSCTHALEMSAMLIDFKKGDEIIMPSYTFVSCANAFIREGAKVVFCDSQTESPNLDLNHLNKLINKKTKAILAVHYGGASCDMDSLQQIAKKNKIFLIEDAAQAIDSYYNNKPLGSFGDLATFSFHGTKNIQCGEGGLLVINNKKFINRAEIIREKGTNRKAFISGKVDKYRWIDKGSSYLPSDLLASVLYGQLKDLELYQNYRLKIWEFYYKNLLKIKSNIFCINHHPDIMKHNAHLFYLLFNNKKNREKFINFMKKNNVQVVSHYQSLHKAPYFSKINKKKNQSLCPNADIYTNQLVRLPLFHDLKITDARKIVDLIQKFNNKNN